MYDSYMLAQFFGIFFTILGIGMIFNQQHMKKMMLAVTENHAVQFVAAVVPLLLGSFIVVVHNDWVSNWSVLVSIVCWLILLGGAFRAIFPAVWIKQVKKVHDNVPVMVIGLVLLVLGLVLLYFGFDVVY